jgi:hypothetical protein
MEPASVFDNDFIPGSREVLTIARPEKSLADL